MCPTLPSLQRLTPSTSAPCALPPNWPNRPIHTQDAPKTHPIRTKVASLTNNPQACLLLLPPQLLTYSVPATLIDLDCLPWFGRVWCHLPFRYLAATYPNSATPRAEVTSHCFSFASNFLLNAHRQSVDVHPCRRPSPKTETPPRPPGTLSPCCGWLAGLLVGPTNDFIL